MIGWAADGSTIGNLLVRRGGWEPHAAPPMVASCREERPAIFGGVLCHDYGHFLTETLARMWAIAASDRKVIWVPQAGWSGLRTWQRDILALVGLGHGDPDMMTEPTRFTELVVPSAGIALNLYCDRRYTDAIGVFPFRSPDPHVRVWLSRSRLGEHKARVENEAELEAQLRADGWRIVHPETLPVTDQLAAMAQAAVVAGFDGSAFHTVLLGRDVRARLITLPRGLRKGIKPTFHMIAAAKGFRQDVMQAGLVHVAREERGNMLTRISDVADLRGRLNAESRV